MSLSKSSINSQQNFTAPNSNCTCIYEFEDFRLDAAHLMLYRNDQTVSLKPKVVETLVALVERSGEVVSKEELMNRLWQDAFVEEANLSQNIYQLRKTLGECAGGKPLIETFWRRGYRFNGRIRRSNEADLLLATHTRTLIVTEEETIEDSAAEQNGITHASYPLTGEVATELFSRSKTKSVRAKIFIGTVVLIGGALLVFGGMPLIRSILQPGTPNIVNLAGSNLVINMTRLTPDLNIDYAAISPDGKYLAYDMFEKGRFSLYVKDIASGGAVQVMPPSERGYGALHFSPDGTQIYYTKVLKTSPNGTIFRIPAFGGEPQAVAQDVLSPQAFSPDGTQIAFVRHSQLVIAQTDGSGERILRTRDGNQGLYETWDSNMSWSPDGKRIAICGWRIDESKRRRYELIEVSVDDGAERYVPIPDWNYLDDVEWLPDQSGLIVRARETEASPWQIWRVSYPNGEISRITNDLNNYDNLSLSADSRLLVVRKHNTNLNVWTMPLSSPDKAKQITFGGNADDGFFGIAFTPDSKIIYTSPRGGNVDLWVMNADGTGQRQLTKNSGGLNSRPSVTADGRTIIFISSRTGLKQVWRMDTDGGNPSQLTNIPDGREADHPVLSPDGSLVYFTAFGTDGGYVARIPINGGPSIRISETGWPLSILPDGKLIVGAYDKTSPQPWKTAVMSVETGEMMKELKKGLHYFADITPDSESTFVVRGDDRSNIWRYSINGGKMQQLTGFDGGVIRDFAISPDFTQVAISRGNPSAEAILITDFR